MIVLHPLTLEERRRSQKNYIRFGLINGLSYACLGETIIVLLAVQMHMPDVLITFVGAMLYIGFLLLPMGVRQTAKYGAAQSQATFWVCRNISALLAALSAILAQYFPVFAWCLLLFSAFMFYGFRAAGVVLSLPLVGEITNDEDRSQLVGNAAGAFYFSGVIMLLVVSYLLKLSTSTWVLCGVVVFGAMMGVTASRFIRAICETDAIRESAKKPILPVWKEVKSNPMIRQFLIAGFCKNLAVILMIPASILYLKKGFGFSDAQAVLFSAAQICASFLSSCISGKIIAKTGPRLGMIASCCICLLVSVLWIFAPFSGTGIWQCILAVLIFFLCGTAVGTSDNAVSCYFLMSVPKEQQIAGSVATNVIQGAGAGISAMAVSAALLWLANRLTPLCLKTFSLSAYEGCLSVTYKLFFCLVALVQIFAIIQSCRLKTIIKSYRTEHGDDGVRRTVESGRKATH